MPYLLLAVGALMAMLGAYAGISGYHIVQVEEGWSSVIAGSVLFTGGILTMALGLVLRTLGGLEAKIVARPLLAPLEADVFPEPAVTAPAAAANLSPGIEAPEAALPTPPLFGAPSRSEPETAAPDATASIPAAEDQGTAAAASTPPTPAEPADAPPAREAEPEAPPSAPSHSDWLDRALADLDQELPRSPPPVPRPKRSIKLPKADPLKADPLKADPLKADPVKAELVPEIAHEPAEAVTAVEAASPDPLPAVEPAPPVAPPQTSAVIGRYEADGTTYVMFADGSIEAQSPNGVYRFASMAELKSFIES